MRFDPMQVAALDRARGALSVLASTTDVPRFSIKRALGQLLAGSALTGADREYHDEVVRARGLKLEQGRHFLPWSWFGQRDLAVSGTAGVLVQTSHGMSEAIDLLRPWSVTTRAGIQIMDQLQDSLSMPKTGAGATAYWLGTETAQITSSTPGLRQVSMSPKNAGAICTVSKQLLVQARGEDYLRRDLLRTLGTLVDRAVLDGSGVSGQPLGILRTPSIGSVSGTSLDHADVLDMKQQVADANAPDEFIGYLGTPQVRELLEGRERATGSGFIWADDKVAARPAYATTDLPTSTLICGAWPEILLGLWGDGFEFDVNPSDPSGFRAGTVQMRVMVSCDVGVLRSTAFCVASSIT